MSQLDTNADRDPGDEDDGARKAAHRVARAVATFRLSPGESIHVRTPAQRSR